MQTAREEWQRVCAAARQFHLKQLKTVRPIEARSIFEPDGVMFWIESPDRWQSIPYTLETRAEVLAQTLAQARQCGGCPIAFIVLGVAPEQIGTQIELRPALLTKVMGGEGLAAQQLEIVQRIELSPNEVVAYGAVSRESVSGVSGAWCPDGLGSETDQQRWPQITWALGIAMSE
jgi:hypothetical protein